MIPSMSGMGCLGKKALAYVSKVRQNFGGCIAQMPEKDAAECAAGGEKKCPIMSLGECTKEDAAHCIVLAAAALGTPL